MNTTLVNSIVRKVGKDSLRDVALGGADAGWPDFTYYRDTTRYFRTHRKAIVELAESMADDLGEDVFKMISGFRCLNGDFTTAEVARVLYGPWKDDDAHTMIGNAMAWFALEEVARYVHQDV